MAYHLTDKGESAVCTAQPGKCPKGGQHYETKELADKAAIENFETEYGTLPVENTPLTAEDKLKAEVVKRTKLAQDGAVEAMYGDGEVEDLYGDDAWNSPTAHTYMGPVIDALRTENGKPVVIQSEIDYDSVGYKMSHPEAQNLSNISKSLVRYINEYNKENPDQDYGVHGKGLEGLVASVNFADIYVV